MWNNTINRIKVIFSLCLAANLVACDCENSEETVSDLPNNLVIETLQFDEHSLDFDKNKTGPYQINVGVATQTIRFSATHLSDVTDLEYEFNNSAQNSNRLPFNSGDFITLRLAEGDNLLKVHAAAIERDLSISYSVNINKPSASARLRNLQFSELGAESARALSPAFSRDTYFYEVQLSYSNCSYAVVFAADKPDNSISIAGEDVSDRNSYFGNLDVGVNFVDVFVDSGARELADTEAENALEESGASTSLRNERYTIAVTRGEPTETQENRNANLRSLSIEGQDLDFLCGQNTYGINVNKQTSQLLLTLESEIDGVKMLYDDQDLENNVPMEIALEPDTTSVDITLESLDGSVTNTYQILLNRLETNRVVVESAAELQHALLNAQANDEIRLKPGIYEGPLGLPTSGSDQAAFYSPRSGSRLLPITLTADELPDRSDVNPEEKSVILKVAGNSEASENAIDVLRLSGNYWRVSDIGIEGGDYGVQLQQANYITLDNLDISQFKRSGVSILGNHNQVLHSTLEQSNADTAAAPIHIQGDLATATPSTGNTVNGNRLRVTQATPAILLDVLTEASHILSNDLRSSATAAAPLIVARGNDTSIRYNSFSPSGTSPSAITIEQQIIEEQTWGNQAEIYQNSLARSRPDLLFIQANAAQELAVGENYLSALTYDADTFTSVNYEGGNVSPIEDISPVFRISPIESPEDCLGLIADEDIDDFFFVIVKPCGESEEFYWQFEFSSSNYVYIKNISQDEGYLNGLSSFIAQCPSIQAARSVTFLGNNLSGFAQQWAINSDEDGYWFTNKFNDDFALTIAGATYSEETPAVVCGFIENKRQKFMLKD